MTSTETKITFETLPQAVEEIKVELTHLKVTVERLLEMSSGTQSYSKASQIGEPLAAASEIYDLKTAYDEKNGAPTAATPKVFMKYFFVNTKTGEKSGEMMAMITLN